MKCRGPRAVPASLHHDSQELRHWDPRAELGGHVTALLLAGRGGGPAPWASEGLLMFGEPLLCALHRSRGLTCISQQPCEVGTTTCLFYQRESCWGRDWSVGDPESSLLSTTSNSPLTMRLNAPAFLGVQGMIPSPLLRTLCTASSSGQRPGPGTRSSGYSDAISEVA